MILKIMKDKILKEYEKGNIVIIGSEGLQGIPINEFIKQPIDGMLYDLNRNEAVVLTFIDDPRWVNDYAVCKTIRALGKRIEELEQKVQKKIFAALHNPMTEESSAYTISLHKTRKGAEMAIEFHQNECRKQHEEIYKDDEDGLKDYPFDFFKSWDVAEMEVKE